MRTKYIKGSISIIIDYGDDTHNPDEIKNPNNARVPYIQYEEVWYKCKSPLIVNIGNKKFFVHAVDYLLSCNYSEELFLDKILNVIM